MSNMDQLSQIGWIGGVSEQIVPEDGSWDWGQIKQGFKLQGRLLQGMKLADKRWEWVIVNVPEEDFQKQFFCVKICVEEWGRVRKTTRTALIWKGKAIFWSLIQITFFQVYEA